MCHHMDSSNNCSMFHFVCLAPLAPPPETNSWTLDRVGSHPLMGLAEVINWAAVKLPLNYYFLIIEKTNLKLM